MILLFSCYSLQPMNCSTPGSSVHGVLQARILEWVAISSSRRSPQPKDQTSVFCISSIGRREACHLGSSLMAYDILFWSISPEWNTVPDTKQGKLFKADIPPSWLRDQGSQTLPLYMLWVAKFHILANSYERGFSMILNGSAALSWSYSLNRLTNISTYGTANISESFWKMLSLWVSKSQNLQSFPASAHISSPLFNSQTLLH